MPSLSWILQQAVNSACNARALALELNLLGFNVVDGVRRLNLEGDRLTRKAVQRIAVSLELGPRGGEEPDVLTKICIVAVATQKIEVLALHPSKQSIIVTTSKVKTINHSRFLTLAREGKSEEATTEI